MIHMRRTRRIKLTRDHASALFRIATETNCRTPEEHAAVLNLAALLDAEHNVDAHVAEANYTHHETILPNGRYIDHSTTRSR